LLLTCFSFSFLDLIAVINELEGLSRGIKPMNSIVVAPAQLNQKQQHNNNVSLRAGDRNDPKHAAMVAEASKQALSFLKSKVPAVK